MQGTATARADLHREVEVQLLPLQVLGQARTIQPGRYCRLFVDGSDGQQLLDPAYVGADVLEPYSSS
jgi:hypothetical protein